MGRPTTGGLCLTKTITPPHPTGGWRSAGSTRFHRAGPARPRERCRGRADARRHERSAQSRTSARTAAVSSVTDGSSTAGRSARCTIGTSTCRRASRRTTPPIGSRSTAAGSSRARSRSTPHPCRAEPLRPDGYLSTWVRRGAEDRGMHAVHQLAERGRATVEAMGSERFELARRTPAIPFATTTSCSARRSSPGFHCSARSRSTRRSCSGRARADRLSSRIPVFVSHMSYGALGAEAKEALARGASAAGTAVASGEGGAHPQELAHADRYIFEMASGLLRLDGGRTSVRRGDRDQDRPGREAGTRWNAARAKVTAEIAAVRGVEPGTTVHSPARFSDIDGPVALAHRVAEIRELTGGVPIGIKFAAGDVERDLAVAIEAGADWVTIDGLGGGTGAAPRPRQGPRRDAVDVRPDPRPRLARRPGRRDVQLVATGGFRTPDEIAKAPRPRRRRVALATAA